MANGDYRVLLASRVSRNFAFLSKVLSAQNLTKRASLNAFASALDYGARLIVGFLITPFLVAGLGDFYYGTWQVLQRLAGSISPASGRATQALKWTLAKQQHSSDYEEKRRYVGTALAVWALFLPLLVTLGAVLAWFVPHWLKNAPPESFRVVRLATGLLVVHVIMTSLAALPESAIEGENLGYKRMGLSALLVIAGGGLVWLALYLNTGIVGVAAATLTSTTLVALFFLYVARSYIPWFGVARPSARGVREFLALSIWFLAWNLIMNLMMASDVTVLGLLDSVESVTDYTLSKYAPETLITIISIAVFGVAPGLGGVIGSGDLAKAVQVRGEMMSLSWLAVAILGPVVLLWNRSFVSLWVGPKHYVGTALMLLIVLVVFQFVLIRNDASIIDLTLRLRGKVLMGGISTALSLLAAAMLVGYFKLGIAGLCVGIIAGRLILSVGYPTLIGRFLGIPFSSQCRSLLRPAAVTVVVFSLAAWLDRFAPAASGRSLTAWLRLAVSVGATLVAVAPLVFYAGLSAEQRRRVLQRARALMSVGTGS
jgi:O-antigen/teichoic acid export membrane protein